MGHQSCYLYSLRRQFRWRNRVILPIDIYNGICYTNTQLDLSNTLDCYKQALIMGFVCSNSATTTIQDYHEGNESDRVEESLQI